MAIRNEADGYIPSASFPFMEGKEIMVGKSNQYAYLPALSILIFIDAMLEKSMVSREYILEALIHEANVCKHLFTKIPEGDFDFRLSDKQRSTLELLRYLASCGIAPMKSIAVGDWGRYDSYAEETEEMTPEEFPALMDRQIENMRETFAEITDDDLHNRLVKAPGVAGEVPMGAAIMRTSYAWLVAYRMQLFLHVKASGVHSIGTSNNWAGIDRKPKEERVEEVAE